MKRQITGKRVINIVAFVLAFFVCFFVKAEMISAETVASGTTGATNNIEWVLDDQGVLTITGEGDMPDYGQIFDSEMSMFRSSAPWGKYMDSILSVAIMGNVSNIGDYAFYDCSSLVSINISDSVESIGDYAFSGCLSLISINIPDGVKSIGSYAFIFCRSLTSINISDSVQSIGHSALSSCESLTGIIIPDSVESIGPCAFQDCYYLTIVNIPDSVQSIGEYAFSGCSNVTVYFSGSTEVWDVWRARVTDNFDITQFPIHYCLSAGDFTNSQSEQFHWGIYDDGSLIISGYGDIPDFTEGTAPWYSQEATIVTVTIAEGITSLGNNSFAGCSQLTNAYLPDSMLSIGTSAFEGCSCLEFMSIPDNVASISDNSFSFCSSLSGIIIPTSIETIGTGVFKGCSNLSGMYFLGTASEWSEMSEFDTPDNLNSILHYVDYSGTTGNHVTWHLFDDGFMNFSGYGAMTHYQATSDAPWYSYRTKIKSIRTSHRITSVGARAFDGYNRISSFVANSNISIGSYSFQNNTFLTTVKSAKGLSYIANGGFCGCTKLEEIPSIEGMIYYEAFYNCNNLKTVCLGNNVSMIDAEAFYGCSSLKSIIIPDKITAIGMDTFYGCTSLEFIRIPNGVTSIGSSAFSNCSKLTDITLPDNIAKISEYCFYNCTSLSTIVVPDNVSEISIKAFSGCTGLKTIVLPEGIGTIGESAFESCFGLTDVYYKGTEADWSTYVTIGTNNECLTNTLFHYGLSQAATDVQAAISAIGTVAYTAECWNKIVAAFELYNSLSDLDKALITNYSTLTAAEKSFTDLELTDTPNAVLITSRISDGTMSVVPVSGGGMYYSIRGGDIQAYASVYYNFVGWYQDYGTATEIKLGTSLKLHVVPQATMNITALYQPVNGKTFSVTIAADSFTYCDDETIFSGEKTFTCTPGQEITITYTDDSRDFINWIGKDRQPVSRKKTITLVVTGNMSIESNSVAKGTGGNCAMVYFDDENGNAILSQFYYSIDSIVFPNPPAVSGKSFEKWSMTAYEIKKKMATDYFIHVIAVYAETPE